jgi:hypothetical protein
MSREPQDWATTDHDPPEENLADHYPGPVAACLFCACMFAGGGLWWWLG